MKIVFLLILSLTAFGMRNDMFKPMFLQQDTDSSDTDSSDTDSSDSDSSDTASGPPSPSEISAALGEVATDITEKTQEIASDALETKHAIEEQVEVAVEEAVVHTVEAVHMVNGAVEGAVEEVVGEVVVHTTEAAQMVEGAVEEAVDEAVLHVEEITAE
mmetsp:Transcript_15377/g.15362  ORF Transcript_15377/g.15362 Transcript_15377/m.15362 type:complete len:159 (-) Transcript_15377:53-529(-)